MEPTVLFDVDGVIVDSYEPHFLSWQRMFAEIDVEFTDEQFRGTFGRTNADIFAELYSGQLTPERVVELGERKESLYREILRENFVAMTGAMALIDNLADARFRLGIGSSGPPANIALTLEMIDRADKFDAIVTGADVERGKPDPQVFAMGAEKLGVDPACCAVIEDAPQGVEAANRAGMTSIALTGTTTREALAHADLVVDHLAELDASRIKDLIRQHA